jgi:hypothetical protein
VEEEGRKLVKLLDMRDHHYAPRTSTLPTSTLSIRDYTEADGTEEPVLGATDRSIDDRE